MKFLKRLDSDFVHEVLSIPTYNKCEYRLITYIMLWAISNHIEYQFDNYGNIYLTKGEISQDEFYPCVTAHLDNVQKAQTLYAMSNELLKIKTRYGREYSPYFNHQGKTEIYTDDFGLGGDDKAGVAICLSMFAHVQKLKACFFVEEEYGCKGSQHLDIEWFKNVGYVIGFDSPELNRAAYSCGGVQLMNEEFFRSNGLDKICFKHGVNIFNNEPYTDVLEIRLQTNIVCMNFGSGYYKCHTNSEYCVLEDMDESLDMGVDIISHLGLKQYILTVENGIIDEYFQSLRNIDDRKILC